MQLGFENKKQARWAAVLGGIALLTIAWRILPLFMESSNPSSSAQAAAPAPVPTRPLPTRSGGKQAKKPQVASLDPTLRLDLLASSEKTVYQGNGRNIFVSQAEDVKIETPKAPAVTDHQQAEDQYKLPQPAPPPPIPLKFYGFANSPGEPKRVFLKKNDDVFVAGEGEIVDRRYKVIRISPTSVEIQDMVYSGPAQTIPLTQG